MTVYPVNLDKNLVIGLLNGLLKTDLVEESKNNPSVFLTPVYNLEIEKHEAARIVKHQIFSLTGIKARVDVETSFVRITESLIIS